MSQQVGPEDDCNWTYPGSNKNVPTIMVLRPTWDEFKDFNRYLKTIEDMGAYKGGIAKIIPPKEWVPRREKFDVEKCELKINDPVEQVVNGNRGIYNCINMRKKQISVKEFYNKATSPKYRTPQMTDLEDVERKYWKNITFVAPLYGADVPGSITEKDCTVWNIQKLGSILDWVNTDYKVKIDGVNTAYLYFGMWKSSFAWHTEDMDLHSINYLHYGESKFWYSIPPEYARRFERMALGLFPSFHKDCPAYLRHKMCMISPNVLRQNSIPYNKIAQKEGEIMVTFPLGYHSGFNTGFNVAESTNFATERWVEYGKRCSRCHCRPDTVNISMDCFVKRLQPERYDNWLKGTDYGRHPEEPTAKLTPAAPPTAEEFMVNIQNKDKEIPLCLLEPKSKKRRYPIHKNKNPDKHPHRRMATMGVADEEESEEDEPISKISRKHENAERHYNANGTSKPKSNKKITHTSELWNSLDTIMVGVGGTACNESGDEIKEKWASSEMIAELTRSQKTSERPDLNSEPLNNLDNTISRLQRSLSKGTFPDVLPSPLPSTVTLPPFREYPPIQSSTISPLTRPISNVLQHGSLHNKLQQPVNSTFYNFNSHNILQPTPLQYQPNTNQRIPITLHQQQISPNVPNLSLRPQTFITSTIPSTGALRPLHSFENTSSTIKDYLGTLNPIQTCLNSTTNTNVICRTDAGSMKNLVQTPSIVGSQSLLSCPTSYSTINSSTGYRNMAPVNICLRRPESELTATTKDINLLQNPGARQNILNHGSRGKDVPPQTAVLLTTKFSTDVARIDWARSNQLILSSKDKRQIRTSVTILERRNDGSAWQPPLKLPVGNAWGWQVNGFVNMFESAIYINLHGPRNMARSFMLPFRNILATTKKSQMAINAKQDIWPPGDDMLALCEDVSKWELHMCINPNTDIKATIIDPWKKTYLLTIPGKLLA